MERKRKTNHVSVEFAGRRHLHQVGKMLKLLYMELGEEANSIEFLSEELIEIFFRSDKTRMMVAKDDQQNIIGIATVTESQAIYAGGFFGSIDEMYVYPEYRSQKIGHALIEFIKKFAIDRQWKRIDVTAPTELRWENTVRFYEENGFSFTGPKLKYVV